jgi:predicted nucleic acid-binding protein
MYLLDTDIVSEAYKHRAKPANWLSSIDPASAYLSVITLGEIERGVVKLRRQESPRAARLAIWLKELRHSYSNRILPITEQVAIVWGELSAGRSRSEADGLIAATALQHDLILVTRNVADFEDTGVTLLNPWAV